MLNKICFWLLLIGILYGFGMASYGWWKGIPADAVLPEASVEGTAATDSPPVVNFQSVGRDLNRAAIEAATSSVDICLSLIGTMALWLGLLRVAEDAGLVTLLAKALRPLMRFLFPEVPDGHPAQGAMLMNMAANVMGLDNGATPFGVKAMQELQTLNPQPDTATNAMATFLAINTSSITLIPFTIIAYRHAAESTDPAGPIMGMILATAVSTLVAILTVKWLARWPRFAAMPAPKASSAQDGQDIQGGV